MTGMAYAPVFPVPFLALARMSRPDSAMGMEASWIGDGFSQPDQTNCWIRFEKQRNDDAHSEKARVTQLHFTSRCALQKCDEYCKCTTKLQILWTKFSSTSEVPDTN